MSQTRRQATRWVTVRIGAADPPTGVVLGDSGTEVAFAGWLGMLQAVMEQFRNAAPSGSTKEVRRS